jgi:hypothetical protein
MKHALVAVILAVSAPAFADVTIRQTVSGKGLGMPDNAMSTTYIKGGKMRTDFADGDKMRTTIFDVDGQKLYIFDSKKMEADVWDMAAFGAEISKSVDVSGTKGSFKANGQTKSIGGKTAAGYDINVSTRAPFAGSKDTTIDVMLHGPVWIVKSAPGTSDYVNFYKMAADKGWIFTDPRAAKAQPGQAKAMAEMYRQVTNAGGIPYETTFEIEMGGEGPMAALVSRLGHITMNSTVNAVETGGLADDLFAPPAGYKLNPKK